ncbi:PucR family transcriptional regulator [Kitasatospora atroaurantiaca]|uniref:Purine catabolism regulatory family protein n=1 Tax=Kitasatospora atroaurantiaca TaxID=285545 RepID=A0A561EL39_9ACTN|nr:PucR family transcriptional regulator [Kitasatospora atroaurantiaca]TWE16336.1 purine catabolism regulatory family protein [Kitasatospora atroaurantiaca]
MIVGDLLELDDLHIGLAWGTAPLLGRQVTGVTSTDLQDPARYLQPGELVLTGLVWWQPDESSAALRFATSLRSAGVAALLAGEGTHGAVPESLVEACRMHGIPLLSVPAGTSFRAVTDRVYLRLWGDLQARSEGVAAIPDAARHELLTLLHTGAPLGEVLALAVARLGVPDCSMVTAAGRVLASSAPGRTGTREGIAVGPQDGSPFDGWLLRPHTEPELSASAVLHGLAELLAPLATRARATASAQRQTAAHLVELLAQDGPGLADAMAACGLPSGRPLVPVTARIDGAAEPRAASWAATALAEALHGVGAPFAAATDGHGGATALVAAPAAAVTAGLRAAWPALQAELTGRRRLRAGVGPSTAPASGPLRGALVQASYTLSAAADSTDRTVGSSGELGSLAALLRGIPAEVTAAFHDRLLAPLAHHDRENGVSLLGTLGTFLDHDGSWARTAEALHIHVNTVHYRIRRIEELTGRSLGRLEDRLDLRAALLCSPGRGA